MVININRSNIFTTEVYKDIETGINPMHTQLIYDRKMRKFNELLHKSTKSKVTYGKQI